MHFARICGCLVRCPDEQLGNYALHSHGIGTGAVGNLVVLCVREVFVLVVFWVWLHVVFLFFVFPLFFQCAYMLSASDVSKCLLCCLCVLSKVINQVDAWEILTMDHDHKFAETDSPVFCIHAAYNDTQLCGAFGVCWKGHTYNSFLLESAICRCFSSLCIPSHAPS